MGLYIENASFTTDKSHEGPLNTYAFNAIFIEQKVSAKLSISWSLGRDYEKSKVCEELTSLGRDDFTSL